MTEGAEVERAVSLAPQVMPRTLLEGLGLLGVAAGLWLVAGAPGVVGAAVVAVVLYALAGVYAFGAGQFVLVATLPARLTPELVVVEAGLVLVLVAETTTRRGLGRSLLGAVALTLVAVAVGTVAATRADTADTLVWVALSGFILVAVALWAVARRIETAVATARHDHREGQ